MQRGTEDEFSYLEDATDERTRRWITQRNERMVAVLESDPRFQKYFQVTRDNLDAQAAATSFTAEDVLRDGFVYQTWRDSRHPRGVWRRTSLQLFLKQAPEWETLLDLDTLTGVREPLLKFSRAVLSPNGKRSLVALLHQGVVVEWREFDLQSRTFIADGFRLPPTKASSAVWRDEDTLIVSTDAGAGTLDANGFPMVIKEWRRGQPFEHALELVRREPDHTLNYLVAQGDFTQRGRDGDKQTVTMKVGTRGWWELDRRGRLAPMNIPRGVQQVGLYAGHYLFPVPRDAEWEIGDRTLATDTLVAVPASEITSSAPTVQAVIEPQEGESINSRLIRTAAGVLTLRERAGLVALSRVRLHGGRWQVDRVPLPDHGLVRPRLSDLASGNAFVLYESELQPQTLYRVDVEENRAEPVALIPARFDAGRFVVEELTAKSADGTAIPYRLIRERSMRPNRTAPVLISGYGAAGLPQYPQYNANLGALWLEKGGLYVAAGVRGGGEFGASWHVKGVERQHTYDDMLAVAQDLIARRLTSAKRIGLFGHSAGGLLAGVMITQQPDLFGAAVLLAPMLDNFRMDLLLGGEGMFGSEYGSPGDPRAHDFLARTSPFQNLRKHASFPVPLILTATDDQNVLPAQPRRFAAKMDALGMPYLFHESPDGGHAAAAEGLGRARLDAWMYTYLAQRLLDADAYAKNP